MYGKLHQLARQHGRLLGSAISAVAIAAFAVALSRVFSAPDAAALLVRHWDALLLAMALYLATYVPMAAAWLVLARAVGAGADRRAMVRIYLVSQVGKYLPGNVGHLLGRAWLAERVGVPLRLTAWIMSLEVIVLLVAGALAAAACLLLPGSTAAARWTLPLAAVALALGLLAVALALSRRRLADLRPLLPQLRIALACYVGVFGVLAAAHCLLLGMIGGGGWTAGTVAQVVSAVVLSWLVGFMTPGAPAGLGVREMSLLTLLTPLFSAETVLATAAFMRMASIAGDGIAWAMGLLLTRLARQRDLAVA